MSSPSSDPQLECQGASAGRDDSAARGFGEHRCLASVAPQQGAECSEPAIFFADDGMHRDRTFQPDARGRDGPHDGEIDGDAGLHVARATAVENAPPAARDVTAERIALGPVLEVTRGHDIDVSL